MLSVKHSAKARNGAATRRQVLQQASITPKRVVVSGKAAGHDTLRRVREHKRSSSMETVAGLWIDRRKAVIAVMSAAGDVLTEVHADVEHEPSRFGGFQATTSFEAQMVQPDDRHQRAFSGHLKRFYDRVVDTLGVTHAVFICGPGEAKGEFRKHLAMTGPKDRKVTVETSAALSTRQVMARIRAHFRH